MKTFEIKIDVRDVLKSHGIEYPLDFDEAYNQEYGMMVLRGYIHDEDNARPAVIVCPGGGYVYITPHESDQTAMAFYGRGYNAYVCVYPTRRAAVYPAPQFAALCSLLIIRKFADEFNTIADKIAVAGFSAGAHVAATAGTMYDEKLICEIFNNGMVLTIDGVNISHNTGVHDDVHSGSVSLTLEGVTSRQLRPDAMILLYPCIGTDIPGYFDEENNQVELRCDRLVNQNTPPAFIVTSFGDKFVSCNQSLNMARALSDNDVPFELHCFEVGDHGALNSDNLACHDYTHRDIGQSSWFELCMEWLKDRFDDRLGFGSNLDTKGRIKDDYFKVRLCGYPDGE